MIPHTLVADPLLGVVVPGNCLVPLYTPPNSSGRIFQTLVQERTTMQTVGGVLKTVEHEIHLALQHLQSWAKRVGAREPAQEILFLLLSLTLCAGVVYLLHKAVQNSLLMGI